jgi:hypothetical protein
MVKEVDGVIHEMVIKGNYIYGYFKKDGTLYKIYQPMVRDNKFIKVCDHIQGLDQLTMSVPYLVICSSLKDVMGFVALGYANAEAIAPDSENCMMPAHIMTMLLLKYKKVVILFDNDQGGLISAKKYLEKYAIPYVILEMSKDLTDSIKDHNINRVREVLTPAIKLVLGNE